jgi:PAS domain S-box-containing protein
VQRKNGSAQGTMVDILISIVAAVGFGLTALYVAVARRHKPTWKAGVIMLLACAELTSAHVLQRISSDLVTKVFWYKMIYFGFTITPTAFLCLALGYSGLGYVLTSRTRLLLSVFPALTAGLVFTNEIHGWIWNPANTVSIVNSLRFLTVADAGIWYWVFVAYSYFVMGLGCFFLARLLIRLHGIYGWQTSAVIIAAILAMLGSALDIFGVSPLPRFSATALGLAVGSILVAYILSPLRRRDLLSVSRDAILDSVSDSVIVVDGDGRIVDMNPAAERLVGGPPSQAIAKPLEQFLPGPISIWTGNTNKNSEVTLGDGNAPRVFDLRVSTIQGWQSRVEGQVVVLRDITERKQIENELREQKLFTEHITETVPEIIYVNDLVKHENLFLSTGLSAILGYDMEDVRSGRADWFSLIHPDDRLVVQQSAVRLMEARDGETVDIEYRMRHADGSWRWLYSRNVVFARDPNGRVCQMLEAAQDITERKRSEQLIQTLNAASLAMQKALILDELFSAVSRELKKIGFTCALFTTNDSKDKLIPKYLAFPSEDIKSVEKLTGLRAENFPIPIQSVVAFRQSCWERKTIFLKDIEETVRQILPGPIVMLAHPVIKILGVSKSIVIPFIVENQVIGLFTAQSDDLRESDVPTLTAFVHQLAAAWRQSQLFEQARQEIAARQQAEAKIIQLNVELEQRVIERTTQLEAANKELEAFSYSVSHDLRAPLRAIDGYTRILVEDYEPSLDAEGKRVCAVVQDEARRMGELIDDLLALSRLGRAEMQISKINMETLALTVFQELTTPEDRERIDFHVSPLPSAKGDPSLIHQVWTNLLSNAIKFSSKRARAIIQVTGTQNAEEVIYAVNDNGAGFEMQYADKLFGVFQRLHNEKEFPGTGVGLATVKRIIQRHDGRVWGESQGDQGATFYFSLPQKGV